jgi:hypothetical protein
MNKLIGLVLCLLVLPVGVAAYDLTTAPIDKTNRPFHRDIKWTATGGLDTLETGATFNSIVGWLTAGSTATFEARLIPYAVNDLIQLGTAPPDSLQSQTNYGGTLNETSFHTYSVIDVLNFGHTAQMWEGVILQAEAGTIINISFDRMLPNAPIR